MAATPASSTSSSTSAWTTTSARWRSSGGCTGSTSRSSARRRRSEWLPVDDELAAELGERLARLGYEGELSDALFRWAGNENLEERVDGVEAIDPVVLEELRRRS